MTNVVLVDDQAKVYELFRRFLRQTEGASERFQVSDVAPEAMTPDNSEDVSERIKNYEGSFIMILDMQLYTTASGRKLRDNAKRDYEEIKDKVETTFSRYQSGEQTYLREAFKSAEEAFKSAGDTNDGTFQWDGLTFAKAAIDNLKIHSLVLWIATAMRDIAEDIINILKAYSVGVRGIEPGVAFLMRGQSLSRLDPDSFNASIEGRLDQAEEKLGDLERQASVHERRTSAHARLDSWFSERKLSHPSIEEIELVQTEMMKLLRMNKDEFERDLWPFLDQRNGEPALEIAKSSGTGRDSLGAQAAWLYALMAYREADRGRPWRTVFHPEELLVVSTQNLPITPSLSPLWNEGSLRIAVHRFVSMCLHLFANESDAADGGPLQNVTIAPDRLVFVMNFDAWAVTKRAGVESDLTGSLVQKMARWRDVYLKNRQLAQDWNAEQRWDHPDSRRSANLTARLMVDWLITCALNDAAPVDAEVTAGQNDNTFRILRNNDFLSMNLRRVGTNKAVTEVVFGC